MPKTVLISLAAVVALIVIVVLLGMRYLRTDDEDDFGDEVAGEHGHPGSRGGRLGRDHHTRHRSHHDDDREDPGRTGSSGRAGSGKAGSGHRERGPDPRGAVRAEQDLRWREDSGEMSRGGRVPPRDQHLVKNGGGGRRDYSDASDPVAARARPARSRPGRAGRAGLDDFDSQPGRMPPARDYERDTMERRERRDAGDRLGTADPGFSDFADRRDEPDRLSGRGSRDARDSRGGRDSRSSREARDARDGRPREDAERDRQGATRPNARPDARKNGAKPDREALPAVKPRQGRNKRDSEGDWPTTEWDELSDVDYWAELASDKPLTTTAGAGDASRSQRRESRQEARRRQDARAGQEVRAGERQDAGVPVEPPGKQVNRQERQLERAMVPAVTRAPSLTGSDRKTSNPVAKTGRPSGPIAADDDPLTSPTFPRITTEDSRSYRRTRAAAGDSRHSASHSGPMPAIGADYAAPVGYPRPTSDQTPPGHANSAPASYLPAGSVGSYPAGADPLNAIYSAPGAEPGGYSLPGGMSTAGYLPPASPARDSYGSNAGVRGGYPGPEPGGFQPEAGQVGPQGQPGYQNSMPQTSGYQASGSYSFPAESVGYDARHWDQPGGYQDPGSALGSHQGPEVGYRAEGYPGRSGPAAQASLPGGHADPGYPPAYPGPVQSGHPAPYQSPAAQLPGYPEYGAGYPEYGPGSYNPASVPAQAPESPGYAPGDPYAADPYDIPGYGGTRY